MPGQRSIAREVFKNEIKKNCVFGRKIGDGNLLSNKIEHSTNSVRLMRCGKNLSETMGKGLNVLPSTKGNDNKQKGLPVFNNLQYTSDLT
jgi:hypothetical protein